MPAAPRLKEQTIVVTEPGSMGFLMACTLLKSGYHILGYEIVLKHLKGPVPFIADATKFASKFHQVLSMIRDEAQTLELCFVEQAVFRRKCSPRGQIICSTVSPGFVHEMSHRLPTGPLLADAPMFCAPHAAQQGALTFMLEGDSSVLDWPRLFECMAKVIHLLGGLGTGMSVKVLN